MSFLYSLCFRAAQGQLVFHATVLQKKPLKDNVINTILSLPHNAATKTRSHTMAGHVCAHMPMHFLLPEFKHYCYLIGNSQKSSRSSLIFLCLCLLSMKELWLKRLLSHLTKQDEESTFDMELQ